jgi:uncharacterized membrane protein
VTILLFAAAGIAHALVWRGLAWAATLVAVTAGGGLLMEAVGVHTGIPFGAYAYTDSLGWKLLGVPVIIPLAWTMMAYPALLVGRRICPHPIAGPLVAGAALASWDLFLDPRWSTPATGSGHPTRADARRYPGVELRWLARH